MWQCPLECVWEFELLMMLSFVDVPCVQMEMLRRPHVDDVLDFGMVGQPRRRDGTLPSG